MVELYADMPLIPGIAMGVSPMAQMLLLPPLIFRIVATWRKKSCPDHRQVVYNCDCMDQDFSKIQFLYPVISPIYDL